MIDSGRRLVKRRSRAGGSGGFWRTRNVSDGVTRLHERAMASGARARSDRAGAVTPSLTFRVRPEPDPTEVGNVARERGERTTFPPLSPAGPAGRLPGSPPPRILRVPPEVARHRCVRRPRRRGRRRVLRAPPRPVRPEARRRLGEAGPDA